MFGFFNNKKKRRSFQEVRESRYNAIVDDATSQFQQAQDKFVAKSLVNSSLVNKEQFSRIDWKMLFQQFDNLSSRSQQLLDSTEFFNSVQLEWLLQLVSQFGQKYRLNQSENFVLLSAKSEKKLAIIFSYLESAY